MTDLDAFLPHIQQYAPGVAAPTAYQHIREAAIDFCTRTRTWRWNDSFEVGTYDDEDICTPSGSALLDIEKALFEGMDLQPKTPDWLDLHQLGWRTAELSGNSRYITQTALNTLRLVPKAAGTLDLYLILKPSEDAEQLPDYLAEQYRRVIANGALSTILLIPNQSFSNPQMAAAFGQMFEERVGNLSTLGSRGQQRAPLRTRMTTY